MKQDKQSTVQLIDPNRCDLQSTIRQQSFFARALPVFVLAAAAACSGGGGGDDDGDNSASIAATELAAVKTWNTIAIDATGLDHTPSNQGPAHTFGQQVGPCRAARAEAIVHVAIYEVVNAIKGGYESYAGIAAAPAGTSLRAGVAQAAHDTLVALYPSQSAIFDAHLTTELAAVPAGTAKTQGIALGQNAAAAILFLRANDGVQIPEPSYVAYGAGNNPGEWRQDPIAQQSVALGAHWGEGTPFVLTSSSQFRPPPPPAIDSAEYAAAYNEVKALGGDGVLTPTSRTADQTQAAIYWAYDGVPSLCAPPRLYNQIAVKIATQRGTNAADLARLLAILNVSMSDSGLTSWECKYFYKYWRPITGIREADAGTGPSGLGDNNPLTSGDPTFVPLCAPATNQNPGVNFTPPFPAYVSGHATFGGALFQTLRRFYGTNNIPFTFVSDEYNGVTTDNMGAVRPLLPRTFQNLSQAEEENGQSRVYLGIHWSFDKTAGIQLGNSVANYVYDHAFQPLP